jgi:hypothetical protein
VAQFGIDSTDIPKPCATCGQPLNAPSEGMFSVVMDGKGAHHVSCWSMPPWDERAARDRIASLERRLAVLHINHANLLARVREAGFEISEIDA